MAICESCGFEAAAEFRFCPECGASTVSRGREQRKVVTVLFCDVTGSTALGESLDPEAFRALLARYFERMKTIVERHGAVVEKFIGDAVMAVFGIPAVHEDDALRALHAAAEMQPVFAQLGVEGRIGVCSGEIVTGTNERIATGDAVNVAARLQQAAQPGEVLLADSTLRLAGDGIQVAELEPMIVKGKREPVRAWRLVSVSAARARRFDSPLVGRQSELKTIEAAWERALARPGCELVTVVGEAGLGKSRLVAEFFAGADATVVRGQCLSYGEGITYSPVLEMLKQLEPYQVQVRVDPAATEALAAVQGQGVTARTDEIAWAFRKLLEAVANERPVVAVFDDIQWAEDVLLELIEHVAFLSTGAPILLLCMARPELIDRRGGWGGVLRLQPLDAAEAETLMASRLETESLSSEVRERVLHAAGGNPLFVEEIAAMVKASPSGEIEVPPTLKGLIAARLDQLDKAERSVLEKGSVEGETFHRGPVQALTSDGRVTSQLTALVRKEIIRPDRTLFAGDDAFRFRHLLVRDAAYDALAKSERANLHEQFADWLEAHGSDLAELNELLGYHLEQAARYRRELDPGDLRAQDLATRAGVRLSAAGSHAVERHDVGAAIGLLERAAALLPADRRDGKFEVTLAWARFNTRRGREAVMDGLAAAADRAAAAGDRVTQLGVRLESAQYACVFDAQELAVAHLRQIVDEASPELEAAGDHWALAELFGARILDAEGDAQYGDLAAAAEQVASHARLADLGWLVDWAQGYEAKANYLGAMPVEACLLWLDQHPEIERRHIFPFRDRLLAMLGRFDEAEQLRAEAVRRAADIGMPNVDEAVMSRRLDDAILRGDAASAESLARKLCEVMRSTDDLDDDYMWTAGLLAQALLELDRLDEAEEWLDRGKALAREPMRDTQILWHRVSAKVLAHRGEFEAAQRLARNAIAIAEQTDMLNEHAAALADLAHVLLLQDREARPELRAALELYERKGNLVMAERTKAKLLGLSPAPAC